MKFVDDTIIIPTGSNENRQVSVSECNQQSTRGISIVSFLLSSCRSLRRIGMNAKICRLILTAEWRSNTGGKIEIIIQDVRAITDTHSRHWKKISNKDRDTAYQSGYRKSNETKQSRKLPTLIITFGNFLRGNCFFIYRRFPSFCSQFLFFWY